MSNLEKAGRGIPKMPPNKKSYSKSQELAYAVAVAVVVGIVFLLGRLSVGG